MNKVKKPILIRITTCDPNVTTSQGNGRALALWVYVTLTLTRLAQTALSVVRSLDPNLTTYLFVARNVRRLRGRLDGGRRLRRRAAVLGVRSHPRAPDRRQRQVRAEVQVRMVRSHLHQARHGVPRRSGRASSSWSEASCRPALLGNEAVLRVRGW